MWWVYYQHHHHSVAVVRPSTVVYPFSLYSKNAPPTALSRFVVSLLAFPSQHRNRGRPFVVVVQYQTDRCVDWKEGRKVHCLLDC